MSNDEAPGPARPRGADILCPNCGAESEPRRYPNLDGVYLRCRACGAEGWATESPEWFAGPPRRAEQEPGE